MRYLQELFQQLRENLGDGADEEFDLEPHGYVVVIERGDDPRHLPGVGLGRGGLLATTPEFVEAVTIGENRHYEVAVVYDNEPMMLFLSEVGRLDDEAERWLREQAGEIDWREVANVPAQGGGVRPW